MVSSIYWLCMHMSLSYRLSLDRCLLRVRVSREKKRYFYRFINFLTDPSFFVLFVLNYSFKRIRISLNFARQSKQQFFYLFTYLYIYLIFLDSYLSKHTLCM